MTIRLTCEELCVSQIVWSPIAHGVLTGKYQAGQPPPEGSRATDQRGGADMIQRFMNDDVLTRAQGLKLIADEAGLSMARVGTPAATFPEMAHHRSGCRLSGAASGT